MSQPITFYINDNVVQASDMDSDMSLVDFLHERQNLTGTKICYGIGVCRACTVASRKKESAQLEITLACVTPVSSLQDVRIYTVESLGSETALAPLQKAFLENFSFQCGYCAPGFLMAATAMFSNLKDKPIDEGQLDEIMTAWLGENLCRCTGYVRYMEAIRQVALSVKK
jgi:aerobic-type carbon monoxide dehydrogenase small subunit (CoxS/CutS family)